ncbi:MAG: DUF1638 domain-containing protein [Treponema sp.]|jgi:hypothetical protein|nr:DUF1638 domain-containing protein [Treponema sp.]
MIPLIGCGIFQWELERVLPEIEKTLGEQITAKMVSPALDVSEAKLEQALRESLEFFGNQKCGWLYGGMCHTNMADLAKESGSVYPSPANCASIFLGPEKKKELDAQGNFYYISSGGLRLWRKIYQEERGWDDTDARINFSYFEKIIVLDTGIFEISDEELLDFFDFTQIPVEVEPISLDPFKSILLDLCSRVLNS